MQDRILRMTAQDPRYDKHFADELNRVIAENAWIRHTADLIRLSPKQRVRLEDYMVTWFG